VNPSSFTRTMKLLARRGALVQEQGSTYMADDGDSDEARALRPLHALSVLPSALAGTEGT
jgi:hypothetical protein